MNDEPARGGLAFNLLREPLLSLRCRDGVRGATLPEALALCWAEEAIEFSALRPHQEPPWHAFLVQLAFHAADVAGGVPEGAAGWAEALRKLTPDAGDEAPWCLVSPPDRPGLLQPPLKGDSAHTLAVLAVTPEEIDTLLTAKAHDVKPARMVAATPEEWLFALVTAQTTSGYAGRSWYGVMRMNGGYGSRPFVSLAPGRGAGPRFRRDVAVLLRRAPQLMRDARGFAPDGRRLLWLEPWDGAESLSISDLHPLVIEVCRRLRLLHGEHGLQVKGGGSQAPRIAAADANGDVGDPWAPIETDRNGRKMMTVMGDGFGWRRLQRIFFGPPDGGVELPLLAKPQPEDGETVEIVAAVLVRGQGQTDGFHTRRISVPGPAALRALSEETEEHRRLSALADAFAADAGNVASALRSALALLFRRGVDRSQDRSLDAQREAWLKRFDAEVDQAFFPHLWPGAESDAAQEEAHRAWQRFLDAAARRVFAAAAEAAPRATERRLIAEARAQLRLNALLRRHLTLAHPPEERPRHAA